MNRQAAEMGDATPIAPVGERPMRLSDRTVRLLRSGTVVLIVALYVGGFTLQVLSQVADQGTSWGSGGLGAGLAYVAMTTLFPVAGALITHSQPRNSVGWVLLGIGLSWGLDHLFSGFAAFAWLVHHRLVTAAHVAVQLDQWTWIPAVGLTGTFLLITDNSASDFESKLVVGNSWIDAGNAGTGVYRFCLVENAGGDLIDLHAKTYIYGYYCGDQGTAGGSVFANMVEFLGWWRL